MKIIVTLILFISSLAAAVAFYLGELDRLETRANTPTAPKPVDMEEAFDRSTSYMKGIVKRGNLENVAQFETNLAEVLEGVERSRRSGLDVAELEKNIARYAQAVMQVSVQMRSRSEALHDRHRELQEGLETFNRSIASIGLFELKEAWMELSRMKNAFVREPSLEAKADYELQWMHTKILVGELYLDEPMEAPLFAFLDNHKAYLDGIAAVYAEVGMSKVAGLKTLAYTIKSQIRMMPLRHDG